MSSMRNAVQRRNHKERAQPKEREKWGILEKHRDYALRAKDYNKKKERLKILRQKVLDRNPDEFHFGMINNKVRANGQKYASRDNQVLSQDAVKLLKTQDAGYLRTMEQSTRKLRQRVEQELVAHVSCTSSLQNSSGENWKSHARKHLAFVDTKEAQRLSTINRSITTAAQSCAELSLGDLESTNYDHKDEKEDNSTMGNSIESVRETSSMPAAKYKAHKKKLDEDRVSRKRRSRQLVIRQSRIAALKKREHDLLAVVQELACQRDRMSNSVGGMNKSGLKFKARERKR